MAVRVTKRMGNPSGFFQQKRPDSLALSIATLFIDLEHCLLAAIVYYQPDVPPLRFVVECPNCSVVELGLVWQNCGQKLRSPLIISQIGK